MLPPGGGRPQTWPRMVAPVAPPPPALVVMIGVKYVTLPLLLTLLLLLAVCWCCEKAGSGARIAAGGTRDVGRSGSGVDEVGGGGGVFLAAPLPLPMGEIRC